MMNKLISTVSPHFHTPRSTQMIMLDVIIALVPAEIASAIIFGWRALLIVAVCVGTCVLSEFLFEKLCKRENTVSDLSSIVTGILLAFNLPVTIPIWQAMLGSVIAIIVVKQLFGGIGQNFANPAITARIIMLVAFSGDMTKWITPSGFFTDVNASTSATPLLAMTNGALMSLVCGKDVPGQVLSGGLLLGAFFMATDYATTPNTKWGKIIFGVGCGLITILIRFWGNYPEGVSYSILLMNILTPYISKLTRSKPLVGGVEE